MLPALQLNNSSRERSFRSQHGCLAVISIVMCRLIDPPQFLLCLLAAARISVAYRVQGVRSLQSRTSRSQAHNAGQQVLACLPASGLPGCIFISVCVLTELTFASDCVPDDPREPLLDPSTGPVRSSSIVEDRPAPKRNARTAAALIGVINTIVTLPVMISYAAIIFQVSILGSHRTCLGL